VGAHGPEPGEGKHRCGRYASSRGAAEFVEHFEVDEPAETVLPPSYNVPPTDPVYAVLQRGDFPLTALVELPEASIRKVSGSVTVAP
jgi:putative SOS response-associated peptidase YedK